jgi:general secretion pathway protein K
MTIIAVLGVVAVLFILGVQLGNQVLMANQASSRWLNREQSYYVVRSLAEQAIHLIPPVTAKYNSLQDAWANPIPPLPLDDKIVNLQIEDEERRFNVNAMLKSDGTIDQPHLDMFNRLLTVVQANPNFSNAVADWEDADSVVRFPGGAEQSSYPNYPCKNGPLDSVAELLQIQGCTQAMYDGTAVDPGIGASPSPSSTASPQASGATTAGVPGLKYLCTVHSNGYVNINTAMPAVLEAVALGMPPSVANAIVQYRSSKPFTSVSDLASVPGFDIKYLYQFQQLAGVKSSVYRITANVAGPGGTFTARVYVQLDPNTNRWKPLVWEVHS